MSPMPASQLVHQCKWRGSCHKPFFSTWGRVMCQLDIFFVTFRSKVGTRERAPHRFLHLFINPPRPAFVFLFLNLLYPHSFLHSKQIKIELNFCSTSGFLTSMTIFRSKTPLDSLALAHLLFRRQIWVALSIDA